MNPVNSITISGNLASDPELKYTAKGTAVVNARLMQSESRKNDEGEYETVGKPLAIDLAVWGKNAENFHKICGKGSEVLVMNGKLEDASYEVEGKKIYKQKIVVDEWRALSRGKNSESKG